MIEEAIEIRTADGTSDGFIYRPDGGRHSPGAIHLTDIGGIRPSHREMARRLADKGYTVLLPNIFYRTGRPPMFDFTPAMGDERTMKRFAELAGPMTPDAMERDAAAYVDFLAANQSVSAGKMGVVGYCFTGAMAMRTAAMRPDKIGAAASFHGGRLYVDGPASPHLCLPKIKARLYFGHAIKDQSMPADAIQKLEAALKTWGGKFESETYDGAYHGWTEPDSPVYNKAQSERAFEKLTELFAQTLK
jgi:carboxymethylenebutenolidase